MKSVLLDSDVLLDFFLDREPFAETTAQVLSLCEKGEITGWTTSVIISNTYYLLKRTASHRKVIDKLRQLVSITDVLNTDKQSVIEALNSPFKDFEDALQNFSAVKSKNVEVILTRNLIDYKHSQLVVMTPQEFLSTYFG